MRKQMLSNVFLQLNQENQFSANMFAALVTRIGMLRWNANGHQRTFLFSAQVMNNMRSRPRFKTADGDLTPHASLSAICRFKVTTF